jgi:hypothetical protein
MGVNTSRDGQNEDMSLGTEVIPSKRDKRTSTFSDLGGGSPRGSIHLGSDLATLSIVDIDPDGVVPNVFKWDQGGRNVYITGTFNNWERQIPMHRSGNDFTYIHNLKKGKHAYKFIVDDEWRFASDQVLLLFVMKSF